MSQFTFEEWVRRIPTTEISGYLGKPMMGILRLLDSDLVSPGAVRELLLTQRSPSSLLGEKKFRTLLFESQPVDRARSLASSIFPTVPVEDAKVYEKLCKLPAKYLATLFGCFGVKIEEEDDSSLEQVAALESVNGAYELFTHQRKALTGLEGFIPGRHGSNRVVLHMPTGSGKTRTTMRLIAEFLIQRESKTVLWIANTEELCGQAADEFLKAWKSLGNREIEVARVWGGQKPERYPKEGLIVASAQTLHAMRSNPRDGTQRTRSLAKNLGLLVFDEAHQVLAPTYSLVVDFIASMHDNLPVVGLTATPGRTWADKEQDQRLADYFQGNKVKLTVDGYDSPVRYLIESGYLADPSFQAHHHEWADAEQASARVSNLLDADPDLLRQVGEDGARNLLIREALLDVTSRHARTIYFAPSVENSDAMAFLLRKNGIRAESVTGVTPKAERREALKVFKELDSEPRVLCNYGILTTGFDAPVTSAAVIARPTKSLVLYSQMVGRAMRGKLAGGNAACEIHTIVDTSLPGFSHPVSAFDNWEDVWKEKE